MDRLKDKVAIVTGSTSGIGTGIAKMFGAEGARVVVCGRNEERGAAVVDAIAEAGGTAWFHKLDITQPETVDALFADTKEHWGSIDVLVNNAAGMALKDGRVDEISLEDWDAVFASDVRSTFYCTKTVLPFMQEQGSGFHHQHRLHGLLRRRLGLDGLRLRQGRRRHADPVHGAAVRQTEHPLQLRASRPHRHAAE